MLKRKYSSHLAENTFTSFEQFQISW